MLNAIPRFDTKALFVVLYSLTRGLQPNRRHFFCDRVTVSKESRVRFGTGKPAPPAGKRGRPAGWQSSEICG